MLNTSKILEGKLHTPREKGETRREQEVEEDKKGKIVYHRTFSDIVLATMYTTQNNWNKTIRKINTMLLFLLLVQQSLEEDADCCLKEI